jgi:hypothetical protein
MHPVVPLPVKGCTLTSRRPLLVSKPRDSATSSHNLACRPHTAERQWQQQWQPHPEEHLSSSVVSCHARRPPRHWLRQPACPRPASALTRALVRPAASTDQPTATSQPCTPLKIAQATRELAALAQPCSEISLILGKESEYDASDGVDMMYRHLDMSNFR